MTRIFVSLLFILMAIQVSAAQTVERKYEAVMHVRTSHNLPILEEKDHIVGIAAFRGLAIFPNDEVAVHRYEGWFDLTKGSGPFHGYAMWTFDDGSQITASYSGSARTVGEEGVAVAAKFEKISGTGRYRGVQGSGAFAGRRLDAVEKGGSTYLQGKLTLDMP